MTRGPSPSLRVAMSYKCAIPISSCSRGGAHCFRFYIHDQTFTFRKTISRATLYYIIRATLHFISISNRLRLPKHGFYE